MSDISDDEFGGYDPTTPAKPLTGKKSSARSARSVAGPSSSKPVAASKKGAPHKSSDPIHVELSGDESEIAQDDELVSIPTPPQAPSNKRTRRPEPNGKKKSTAAKGKEKEEPHSKRVQQPLDEQMNIDEVHVASYDGDDDDDIPPSTVPTTRKSAKLSNGGKNGARRTTMDKYERENQDLREELQALASERDKLSRQLEEVLKIRKTEPEEAIEQLTAAYEARLDTQERLITEMTSQMQAMKSASGSGKSYMLHFMTREAADQEQEVIKKEIEHWKDVAKRKDTQLAEKDKQIAGANAHAELLQSDLRAEIERGSALLARQPPVSATRAQAKVSPVVVEDPKRGLVIRLYEDMTNFLITAVKIEKSQFLDLDEPLYTCLITYVDGGSEANPSKTLSLNFTLRHSFERADGVDEDTPIRARTQLIEKFRYTPMHLDKEPEEFVERLEFFNGPFMFSRDQLPVFLKQLTTMLEGPQDEEPADDEDVSK